jgi:hypothetical protein
VSNSIRKATIIVVVALCVFAIGLYAGPRAIEKYAPWLRISAQLVVAQVMTMTHRDVVLLVGDSRVADLGRRHIDRPVDRHIGGRGATVINMGLAGSTTQQWLMFFDRTWRPIPRGMQIVLWLGGNDSVQEHVAAPMLEDRLRALARVLAPANRLLLLDQIPFSTKDQSLNTRVNTKSAWLNARLTERPIASVAVLPIAQLFGASALDGAEMLHDGIHLTQNGNTVVWQAIKAAIAGK